MLVYTDDAEDIFPQALERYLREEPGQRCVILKFSKLSADPSEYFSQAASIADEILEDDHGRIFLFGDGDVCILTRHATHKRLSLLVSHLSHALRPAPVTGLASLFEVGQDYGLLQKMAREKKDGKREQERLKNEQEEHRRRLNALDIPFNSTLLESISPRRQERKTASILLVEDDPFSQRLVHNALNRHFELCSASDAYNAIQSYVRTAPDVLFLDIGLPDADGHDVLRRIFAYDPQAYVIMLSGNGSYENVKKAIDLGAKGFISKPFSRERLLGSIEKSPFIREKQGKDIANGYRI